MAAGAAAATVAAGTVGVNARSSERAVRDVPLDDFVAALSAEIAEKGSPEGGQDRGPAGSVSG